LQGAIELANRRLQPLGHLSKTIASIGDLSLFDTFLEFVLDFCRHFADI
jgi:hypothetical protein